MIPERCDHCDRYCDGCTTAARRQEVETLAARMAYDAGLGASEWEAFVSLAEQQTKQDPLDTARGIVNGALLGLVAWALFIGLLFAAHSGGLL